MHPARSRGCSAKPQEAGMMRRPGKQNACITPTVMSFFRSTLLPAAIVLIFGLALFAVSARIWLPGDMAAPAPIS
jgi:hypothetical protein